MSRKSIFEPERPGARRSAIMTGLFDSLLVGGFITCAILTYFLFFSDRTPPPAAQTPVAKVATPETAPTPEPTPTPEPVRPPVSEDLLIAMSRYVTHIAKGECVKARAMRADPAIPSLENMKRVTKMEMLTIMPYPRVSRSKGAVYVELKITKDAAAYPWKGRIQWEQRDGKWVTTDWNSSAQVPMPERPATPDGLQKR